MLPDLARRHRPDVFVPRVNQLTPQPALNGRERIVVDANFSTLWADDARWTPAAICALLRSTWACACMEAIGTPMGGGALKLEATQLRRLPVPALDEGDVGRLIAMDARCPTDAIDGVILGALLKQSETDGKGEIARIERARHRLRSYIEQAQLARQRR